MPLALVERIGLETIMAVAESMYEEFKEPPYLGSLGSVSDFERSLSPRLIEPPGHNWYQTLNLSRLRPELVSQLGRRPGLEAGLWSPQSGTDQLE